MRRCRCAGAPCLGPAARRQGPPPVFQKQGEERPRYLAASAHGGYNTHPINEVPMDGTRVKIVYHKDGAFTHAFRFAKWRDGGGLGRRRLGPPGPGHHGEHGQDTA
ncbi:NPP1 family protein [Streptomyces rishiriensis]|uniref:NPP1 family protein n=1 Tax=Streptomyces rishiriensis TaxID=68264 RepID=UPI0037B7CC0D